METNKKVFRYTSIVLALVLVLSCGISFYSPENSVAETQTIESTDSGEGDSNISVESEVNVAQKEKDAGKIAAKLKTYKKYISSENKAYIKKQTAIMLEGGVTKDAYNNAYTKVKKQFSLAKKKKQCDKKNRFERNYSKVKSLMTGKEKKKFCKTYDSFIAAKTSSKIAACKKAMNGLIAKAKTREWSDYVQASCYGPYEGECTTATGRAITNGTYYIAVPISRITSYSSWKKMSAANKHKYFYYHEKIYLKKGNNTCTVSVEDCGGFGGYGTTYNGKWCERLFDLTPAVFHALGVNSTGLVKWHY